jgi:DNA-directed RNA polymerase subunit E'/Rpb7
MELAYEQLEQPSQLGQTEQTKQIYKGKKKDTRISSIYSRGMITRNITLPISSIGKNIKETIEENISFNFEGKCLVEGYIKNNSSKVISYSSGLIKRGCNVSFEVVFECEICFPVEGMLIQCIAKNITKAGIKGESSNEIPSPIIVFIAKDHHFNKDNQLDYYSSIQEGDKFTSRVIGQRFELNDKYVSIIAELVKPKIERDFKKINKENKPKIIIDEA